MGLDFKKTLMSERELMEISSLVFVKMAQDGTLDDITVSEHPSLFPSWYPQWTGKAGTILMDEGKLYRSIHDVTNVAQNTKPSETPSMWTRIGDPTQEYPECTMLMLTVLSLPTTARIGYPPVTEMYGNRVCMDGRR